MLLLSYSEACRVKSRSAPSNALIQTGYKISYSPVLPYSRRRASAYFVSPSVTKDNRQFLWKIEFDDQQLAVILGKPFIFYYISAR